MSKFQVGNPGKPKGAIGKRSRGAFAILEAHGFCPITAMIEVYRESRKVYDNYAVIYDAICDARIIKNDQNGSYPTPPEDKAHTYLKIAGDMARDIASYTYPRLKSIEHGPRDFDDLTLEEQLEVADQLRLSIKEKMAARGSGTS